MVEHQTSNLRVVGSSPTSDEFLLLCLTPSITLIILTIIKSIGIINT